MSKAKVRSRLLQLVDSDSEDGIGGHSLAVAPHSTTKSRTSTMPPKKTKAGRPAANRVTKPAPKTSTSRLRATDRVVAAAEEVVGKKVANATGGAPAKGTGRGKGRKPAAEEEEDTVMTEATETVVETPPATQPKGARGRPKKVVVEAEPSPPAARRGRKPAGKKSGVEDLSEIPETQQPDATQSDLDDEYDDLADLPALHSPERVKPGRGSAPVPSSVSKRSLHALSPDKGDPALRRRLGEMTQKYESLEHKYRDLKEVAVREAERNFDKLKKQSEEKSKGPPPPFPLPFPHLTNPLLSSRRPTHQHPQSRARRPKRSLQRNRPPPKTARSLRLQSRRPPIPAHIPHRRPHRLQIRNQIPPAQALRRAQRRSRRRRRRRIKPQTAPRQRHQVVVLVRRRRRRPPRRRVRLGSPPHRPKEGGPLRRPDGAHHPQRQARRRRRGRLRLHPDGPQRHAALQALRRQRWRRRWRGGTRRRRGRELLLHAAAGCGAGPGADRRHARVSPGRDQFPAGAGGQVLREGVEGVE